MTIEKLNGSKILISLCREDMENFRLDIGKMGFCNDNSRKVLLRLMQLACKEAGVGFGSKTILMEALPLQSGCLILVTFADKKKRRTYKVKSIKRSTAYVFTDAENMLCAAENLYRLDAELPVHKLWLFESKYYVLFEYCPFNKEVCGVLCDYACKIPMSSVGISRIKEGGKSIGGENPLKTIGKKIA